MSVTSKPQPDTRPWRVAYTTPPTVKVKDETFPTFTEARTAARKYTRENGLYANAVRA
jgi:hypothetical protein